MVTRHSLIFIHGRVQKHQKFWLKNLKVNNCPIFIINKIGSAFHFLSKGLVFSISAFQFSHHGVCKFALLFLDKLRDETSEKFMGIHKSHPREFTLEMYNYAMNVVSAEIKIKRKAFNQALKAKRLAAKEDLRKFVD